MDNQTSGGAELTHNQRQIWVGQRLNQNSPLYSMAFAWIFPPDFRVKEFQQAWRRVADRSDALRTRVVEREGVPSRRLLELGTCVTEVLDLEPSLDPEQAFRQWCRERCSRLLALETQLVDSVIARLDNGKFGWYLNQHHLITDASSTVLLYRQVAAEYAALLDGDRPQRPEGPQRPARGGPTEQRHDYYPTAAALAEKSSAKAAQQAAAVEHWAPRLARPNRSIPFYGRSAEPTATASTRLTLGLDAERRQALDRLSTEDGFLSLSREMSRFALFATLLLSWLHRISGKADLGFDAPVSGRPTAASKRALGLFIEMFPFAVTLGPDETFRSLGAKCLAEAELFLRHALPATSSTGGAVASNVVLNYFPESFGDFAGLPAEVEWVHSGHGDSVHALRLQVHDFQGSGRITFHFDWNDQALPNQLRRRALRHFEKLLSALLEDPDGQIAAVDVLTGDERQALAGLNRQAFAGGKGPQDTMPRPEQSVVTMFLRQAEANPSRVALRQGRSEMSFGRLREQAEALASTLARQGIEPGDRVAIAAKRSIDTVVAILATLRARAAYVPIDPVYPEQRQTHMLLDSSARLLLAGEGLGSADLAGVAVLPIAEGIRSGQGVPIDQQEPDLDDLAYVLYTSGSTGRPKGVLIEHGGLADYLEWADRQYVRGERLSFPLFTSLSFDLTVTSLFLPLITGGLLEIYPEPPGAVDSALMDVVRADAVDFIKLTPSHLSLLRQMTPAPSRIRRMVVGGEDLKARLAAEVSNRLGGQVEITNEYGPTEAVVGCVAYRYDPDADIGTRVPIGVPADHVQIEILNHALKPVPEGVPGELWISRFGLARGYLGLHELTAERFQAHPSRAGERRYRTGDRVRMVDPGVAPEASPATAAPKASPANVAPEARPASNLEYLGRLDRQLKISGFRVEPAEIEAALLSLPRIDQCAVVTRRQGPAVAQAASEIRHCRRCGLPSNHPRASFDRQGVCSVCRSYESIKEHAQAYFKNMDDLRELFEKSRQSQRRPAPKGLAASQGDPHDYDCMMLLSGGKDSTYALCQLVDMGLSVYAFSLDNGFISEGAKDNIRRITRQLDVPIEFATTPAMNAIFRDSLTRFANVCHGCFKTIYTLSTQRARQLGIPIIVTGLSRGQMFETRLTEEMFSGDRCSPEEIDAAVLAARKVYHRVDDAVSRSLDVKIFQNDRVFEEIRFVDFYRYCDVDLSKLYAYLRRKVSWARPRDTGRSTNCLINDVGIYVHTQQRGYHNYALPYSWDVRMGHKTRAEALAELDDSIDVGYVHKTLAEIGSAPERLTADGNQPQLVAFYVASEDVSDDELREQLAEHLPPQLIPAHLRRLDQIPLTVQGKVDEQALPRIELGRRPEALYQAPEGPVEEYLAGVWQEQLGIERVGKDDSFFQLGGTSLIAMEMMIRLCQEFDLELPLETPFSYPTLGMLATVAEDRILADVAELSDADRQNLLADSSC